ncbi:MAG: hypothetical protein Q8S11_02935 [Daejeonella sp.]|uniref:hypothetical protein n=1 Tax=Daejeonella sp. TaxID=2805397 RepID=UPI0027354EFF|nr:hypothetical protein [Daejeonella sp.]MDP3467261.1 hypothetical protein [Daejeonella sp.]
MKTKALYFLIFLLAFLGLGAIGGGGVLILSPSGQLMGMPLSLLEHSPFTSFLIPGIILFTMLGLAPFLLIFALLKKPESSFAEMLNCFNDMHWSWTFSIYMAFVLIIWIQVQMVFLQTVSWLHTFYIFLALLILFVCLLPGLRKEFKKAD